MWLLGVPLLVFLLLIVLPFLPVGLPMWLLIVPLLGFLVFIHELGHFVTAKRFGITVHEFGFGFPPRIFGVKYGETTYTINWIPLGGFVRLEGEDGRSSTAGADPESDPNSFIDGEDGRGSTTGADPQLDPNSFANQSVLRRAIVLSAGSIVNLVAPLVIFTILFMIPQDTAVGSVVVSGVAPGSPALEAGLRPGDTILAVDGTKVDNSAELIQRIMAKLGATTELNVRRGSIVSGLGASPEFSTIETVHLVPRLNPPALEVVNEVSDPEREVSLSDARRYDAGLKLGEIMTQGPTGIMIGTANVRIVKESHPIWEAVPMSLGKMRDVVVISKNGISRWVAGGPDPGLAGPIGIAKITGEVAEAGISPVFELMALISLSLGIFNMLPIPALDGGRFLFVMIEWVRRGKRISPEREGLVHLIGFVVLIGFIVLVSISDIQRILNGTDLLR